MTALVIIAKECLPGRVKTRLHPPLSLEDAARLAAASLADTLAAVADLPFSRRVLAFDGARTPPGAEAYDVIPQTTGSLDERLAAVFDELSGPTVLIGMDTPQLAVHHLASLLPQWPDAADAVLGPAADGGFWAIGMRDPDGAAIRGVEMSRDDTGAVQIARLRASGRRVALLPELLDVDDIDAARRVAAAVPDGSFARLLAEIDRGAAA